MKYAPHLQNWTMCDRIQLHVVVEHKILSSMDLMVSIISGDAIQMADSFVSFFGVIKDAP